ncbi:MAG: hypothetical protein Q7W29_06255, partial [bacterium]|nr:hypothetical protein [bacterium]
MRHRHSGILSPLFLFCFVAVLAAAGGASAQISPCPDAIGIYFDQDAYQFDIAYAGNMTPLNVYLIVTHPTGDYIRAWECRITETSTFTTPGSWSLNGGLDVDADPWDFVVGQEWCPVVDSTVLLASKTMYGTSASTATYKVTGIPGSISFPGGTPGYVHTLGFNTPLQVATGELGSPQACVNAGCGIVPNCDPGVIDFVVMIDATLDGMSDLGNVAGISGGASDGYDGDLDVPEPPLPPSGYVSLTFPHPEWGSILGDDFRADVRSLYNPELGDKAWPLRLLSSQSGIATLTFQPDFDQSSGWGLKLVDDDQGHVIDLWGSLSYTFAVTAGQPRRFWLSVGLVPVPPLNPTSRDLPVGWSMVGVPLLPDAPGTIGSVLLDDAGVSTYVYSHETGAGYQQRAADDLMRQGRGYWVGATNGFRFTMEGQPDLDGTAIPLSCGWNLVGSPIWTTMPLDLVKVAYQGHRYEYQAAVQMGLVSNLVYSYLTASGSYAPQSYLQPWQGYWLAAYQSGVELWFHYYDLDADKSSRTRPAFVPDDHNWCLALGLDGSPESVTVGRLEKAVDGFDPAWDQPRPPRAPVVAARPELWLDGSALDLSSGDQLTADYRIADGSDVAWDLVVAAPAPGPVTLRWEAADWGGREDLQVYLPHQNRVAVMSMRAQSSLTLDVGAAPVIVRLRTPDLSTGAPEAVVGRCLLRAVPNPFNPR